MYKRAHANFSDLVHPSKSRLATTPTPVTLLSELNRECPVAISVKREDLSGNVLSGTEIRALEYVLHEAKLNKATVIISCGPAQSSHVRAISVASRQLGLDTHLFLLGDRPQKDTAPGSLLFSYMAGSKLYFLTKEQYAKRERIMKKLANRLREKGLVPFVISEFINHPSALWGYISMIKEMIDVQGRFPFSHVVVPVASGITLAGILVAKAMLKLNAKIIGFTTMESANVVEDRIERIITQFNGQYGCNYNSGLFTLSEAYLGPEGAGVAYPEDIYWVNKLAKLQGIFLDPITTGKAFYGLMDQAYKKAFAHNDHVLFIHTGDTFTLLENYSLLSFPNAVLEDSKLVNVGEDEDDAREKQSFELEVEDNSRENYSIQFIK